MLTFLCLGFDHLIPKPSVVQETARNQSAPIYSPDDSARLLPSKGRFEPDDRAMLSLAKWS